MDQNEKQGQRQGEQKFGRRSTPGNQGQPGSQDDRTRGQGTRTERNRGEGISNRGMDRELDEQSELPDRGRSQSDRQSER